MLHDYIIVYLGDSSSRLFTNQICLSSYPPKSVSLLCIVIYPVLMVCGLHTQNKDILASLEVVFRNIVWYGFYKVKRRNAMKGL